MLQYASTQMCLLLSDPVFSEYGWGNGIVLLGGDHKAAGGRNLFTPTSFQLTEIYSFVRNLRGPFEIPNFDAYRLAYALYLIDYGLLDQGLISLTLSNRLS